jgi:hypothetical protein
MKILNNVIKNDEALKIKDLLISQTFSWFYIEGVVFEKENNFQFTHMFYDNFKINSNYFEILNPILNVLKPSAIIKIKANLLLKDTKVTEHTMHIDTNTKNSKTAVYYVNTNNGYTKFSDGKKVSSKINRLVTFDSNLEHAGTTCTDSNYRIVLNFNYFE